MSKPPKDNNFCNRRTGGLIQFLLHKVQKIHEFEFWYASFMIIFRFFYASQSILCFSYKHSTFLPLWNQTFPGKRRLQGISWFCLSMGRL